MSFTTVLFYLLSLVIVIAAFRVVMSRSPVTAVLNLILVFFTTAMLWMIQEAEFLSLLLVVVYVGAVMVMFLFVMMMLACAETTRKVVGRAHAGRPYYWRHHDSGNGVCWRVRGLIRRPLKAARRLQQYSGSGRSHVHPIRVCR